MHSLGTFCQGFLCKMALAAGDSRPSICWISDSRPSKCSINAGLVAKRLKESSRFMSRGACLVQVLVTKGQEVPARCRC